MNTRSGKIMLQPSEQAMKALSRYKKKGIAYMLEEKKYTKWTPEQNIKYGQYLQENIHEFSGQRSRRTKRTFTRMSEGLNIQKSNSQCQTHHQKMMIKYKRVERIIEQLLHQHKQVKVLQNFDQNQKYFHCGHNGLNLQNNEPLFGQNQKVKAEQAEQINLKKEQAPNSEIIRFEEATYMQIFYFQPFFIVKKEES